MKRGILPTPPKELVVVRSVQVPKLSQRADGLIGYQLAYVPDQSEAFFALTSNAGGGYFSKEWVPVSRIVDKLAELSAEEAFPAIALKSVFVGKSVNNASFLAAALVAEGVLKSDPEKAFRLMVAPEAKDWRDLIFTLSGETVRFDSPEADKPEPEPKKNKRGAKVKGVDDADHPPSE